MDYMELKELESKIKVLLKNDDIEVKEGKYYESDGSYTNEYKVLIIFYKGAQLIYISNVAFEINIQIRPILNKYNAETLYLFKIIKDNINNIEKQLKELVKEYIH